MDEREVIRRWQTMASVALASARRLYDSGDFRGTANRAYYAAYQATTAACIAHGDAPNFPAGWNNPSHEQLPGLIRQNGDLGRAERQRVATQLLFLRHIREDADYRPGLTVDETVALAALRSAGSVLTLLEEDGND